MLPALLLLTGCLGSRPRTPLPTALPDAFPYHTLAQIRDHLHLSPDTLTGFNARASMALSAPGNSGSFSARIQYRRDDSLYASFHVTFGVEAARALVTPDSFFFYDRIHKQLVYGPESASDAFLPGPFSTEDLFPNLLGLLVPDAATDWRISADSLRYYLHDPDGRRTFTIDPTLWRVLQYVERDAGGAIVEERTFSDFDTVQGLILPRRVIFRRPFDDTAASIYYRRLELNPVRQSFDLRVSDQAERIPLTAAR